MHLLRSMYQLLAPNICAVCHEEAVSFHGFCCNTCALELPLSDHAGIPENIFEQRFIGHIPIKHGGAMMHFSKAGTVQELIHTLKYAHRPMIGVHLGKWWGGLIQKEKYFPGIECVIPVPIHWKRKAQRGYNQAAMFGQGIAEVLGIPMYPEALKKIKSTKTQTARSWAARMDNVEESIAVSGKIDILRGKHILLVDDVCTTGATCIASAIPLLKIPGVSISVTTIALAEL